MAYLNTCTRCGVLYIPPGPLADLPGSLCVTCNKVVHPDVAAALAHLAAALAQCLPSDNEVIVGHLHEAYLALGGDPYRYRAV